MDCIQVVITLPRISVEGHVVSRTLKAHASVTSTTLNFKTTRVSHH